MPRDGFVGLEDDAAAADLDADHADGHDTTTTFTPTADTLTRSNIVEQLELATTNAPIRTRSRV